MLRLMRADAVLLFASRLYELVGLDQLQSLVLISYELPNRSRSIDSPNSFPSRRDRQLDYELGRPVLKQQAPEFLLLIDPALNQADDGA